MHQRVITEPWTWIPAESQSSRRVLGAFVLGFACLMLGVVIGRLSVGAALSTHAGQLSHAVQPAQSAPERMGGPRGEPTMASKSDLGLANQSTIAAVIPPVPAKLLNPGSVQTSNLGEQKLKAAPHDRSVAGNVTEMDQHASEPKPGDESFERGYLPPKTSAVSKAGFGTRKPTQWQRGQSRPSEQSAPPEIAPFASNDYQDLRAYMLAR